MTPNPTAQQKRSILMTCALPYANGYIHIGHMVEYLQADFWSRFQKMRGNECVYICADDTHGTPIMVKAREQGITPEALIARSYDEHVKDFSDFQIEFSHYGSTNSPENRQLCEEFYGHMKGKGHIAEKTIEQLYCSHDKMFLPDRFVKGTCPKCGSHDQYGDSCDVCGATYSPAELKNPKCAICGNLPGPKESKHLFFKLNDFKTFLTDWLPKHTAPEISRKMMEWFQEDLRDWDISRDDPYFGFAIPGEDKKYFYVWVDAPMGYISTSLQWAQKNGRDYKEFWKNDQAEIYHFIGKDIVYFHTLFWPALLKTAEYRTPNQVFVHGHLMVNGEKMSKSKGTFIAARTYLNHLDPSYLRYYYATKLNGSVDDIDLNLEDFASRVNSDLVGKITNLGSRGAQMLTKKMDSTLGELDSEGQVLVKETQKRGEIIAAYYEKRDFSKAIVEIRELADLANKYFDEKAPWKTLESDPAGTKKVLTSTLNVFRILSIYLKPVLPLYTAQVEKLMNEPKAMNWASAQETITGKKISEFQHLATRIDSEKIKAMVEESRKLNEDLQKQKKAATPTVAATAAAPAAAANGLIEFDDFMKVDLRVAKILEAEEIKEADKLLRLKVDLGNGDTRQIIAGIRASYKASDLVGRLTVVCANLKPRKMKFGMSEGMVLAAGGDDGAPFILSPDSGAKPGQRVK